MPRIRRWDATAYAELNARRDELETLHDETAMRVRDRAGANRDTPLTEGELEAQRTDAATIMSLEVELRAAKAAIEDYEELRPQAESPESRLMAQYFRMQPREILNSPDFAGMVGETAGLNGRAALSVKVPLRHVDPQRVVTYTGGTGQDAGAGLVPSDYVGSVIEREAYSGGAYQMAQRIVTSTTADLRFPRGDDSAATGAIVLTDGREVALGDTGATSQIPFTAHRVTSGGVAIGRTIEDAGLINTGAWIGRRLGRRIQKVVNEKMTNGTGAAVTTGANHLRATGTFPSIDWSGIKTVATLHTPKAAAKNTVTYAEMLAFLYHDDLEDYLPTPGYFQDGFSTAPRQPFNTLFNGDGVAGVQMVRGMVPVIATYVINGVAQWEPMLLRDGVPGMLIGIPYVVNPHLDSLGTGNGFPIVVGNFAYQGLRVVDSMELMTFMDSGTITSDSRQYWLEWRADCTTLGGNAEGSNRAAATEAFRKLQLAA